MPTIRQPWQGIAATAALILLAFAAILPWSYSQLGGVVSGVVMSAIPFAAVMGTFWQVGRPDVLPRLKQPLRGLGLLALTAVVAPVVYVVLAATLGGGRGATPFLGFGIIISVVVSFFLLVVFQGWPFTLLRNPVAGGLALLVASYLLTALLLRGLDFSFLAGASFYSGMDPGGPIPAWGGLVGSVTCLAVLFGFLHFDLWPLSKLATRLRQPLLGLAWLGVVGSLGIGVYLLGTRGFGLTPDAFLVTVPVPFLFGTVVLLTMLQGSLTARLTGWQRGAVSAAIGVVLGQLLARGYVLAMPLLTPDVPAPTAAAGALDEHLWLATALLAMTFPLLAMYRDYFGPWPFARHEPAPAADEQPQERLAASA